MWAPAVVWALPQRLFFRRTTASSIVLPLDQVTSATAGLSVARKLRAAYSGSCIRIRRASDDTETDIGFGTATSDGVPIDSAAIATFCSGTTGYIRWIYDQSGNSNDVGQATTTSQPIIYQSGAVVTGANGRVACVFDGTDDSLIRGSMSYGSEYASYSTIKPVSGSSSNVMLHFGSNQRTALRRGTTNWFINNSASFDTGVVLTDGTWVHVAVGGNTGGDESFSLNGATASTGTAGNNTANSIGIGLGSSTCAFQFHEHLIYNAAYNGTHNTTLFSNADAFYAIP